MFKRRKQKERWPSPRRELLSPAQAGTLSYYTIHILLVHRELLYIYIYIYVYTHIYTHTYTYVYMYTYQKERWPRLPRPLAVAIPPRNHKRTIINT